MRGAAKPQIRKFGWVKMGIERAELHDAAHRKECYLFSVHHCSMGRSTGDEQHRWHVPCESECRCAWGSAAG